MSKGPARKNRPENGDPDAELMLRARRGDREAFGELVQKHHRTVLNFIYRFLGSSNEAEDLAHDVFVRIYKARGSYEPTARFTTFLYRSTLNLCLNHLRSKKIRRTVSIDQGADEESPREELPDRTAGRPEEDLASRERAELVRRAVGELPENQRTAVLLLRWEELSYVEIAETMDLSIMAVKSLLSRAKENLRTRLGFLLRDDEVTGPVGG